MSEIHPERRAPGWAGSISRIEAENRLEGKSIGTFLLREGDILDQRILRALEKSNHEHLESCVLTVVGPEKKVTDYLVVHAPEGWTLYQDNPDLRDKEQYQFSPSLFLLLEKIKSIANKPLERRMF